MTKTKIDNLEDIQFILNVYTTGIVLLKQGVNGKQYEQKGVELTQKLAYVLFENYYDGDVEKMKEHKFKNNNNETITN